LTAAIAYQGREGVDRRESLNHLGNMVVVDRNGLYATIFADPVQQPLRLNYDRKYRFVNFRKGHLSLEFMREWRDPFGSDYLKDYDYLLVRGEELFEAPIPPAFTPVVGGGEFRIYRIPEFE
jgi:hypothetical protein